jgi:hypothetical protein
LGDGHDVEAEVQLAIAGAGKSVAYHVAGGTGLRAAEKLQSFLDSRDKGVDVAEMWVKLDRLIRAVQSAVHEEMWGDIVRKLDGDDESQSGGRRRNIFEPDDGCYDADDFDDLDD